jgi:hypothetical protein
MDRVTLGSVSGRPHADDHMVNARDAEVGAGKYVRISQPVEELSQAGLEVKLGSPADVFQIAP